MKKLPIAKIARPRLSGVVKRERLFHLLDQAQQKPVIWVGSQGGSGKTTLVADWLKERGLPCLWYQIDEGDGDLATFFYYMGLAAKKAAPRYKTPLPLLTPEYLQGIPTFTRRYFENLFIRLKPPFTLVLDNYQDAPLQTGFHDMIAVALDAIPEGINVIVISRAESPAQLSRLKANNKIYSIGFDEIRFTFDESAALMGAQGEKLTEEIQRQLYGKTEGWAAGLVLMMESARRGGFEIAPSLNTQREVFNYFANEIFNKSDKVTQEVLLKTAFLPKIDPATADKLTGIDSAPLILDRLSRHNYFTQRYLQGYQYHPLFREFLLMRAENTFSQAELSLIQKKAAELLKESGQIEGAAQLFSDARDWNSLAMLITSQAQTLVSQGRSKILEEWISGIPHNIVKNKPWLLYWFGICRMAYNPTEARGCLEEAFPIFENEKDISGLFLSWSGIIDTFIYEWCDFRPVDHWIAVAEKLVASHPEFPSPEIEAKVVSGMFSALFWRQPQHLDLPKWAERLNRIVLGCDSFFMRLVLGNNLFQYYVWMGDVAKATLLFDVMYKASCSAKEPLALQWWLVLKAMYSWFDGNHETCLSAIAEGVNLGEKSGVHLLDSFLFAQGIYSGLTLGHPEIAEEFLDRIENLTTSRTIDKSLYHHMTSSVHWHRGNFFEAVEHGKLAVRFSEEAGCPFTEVLCRLEFAITLFDMGRHEEAESELARAQVLARGLTQIEFVCRIFGAWFAFQQGREDAGLKSLRPALATGARQNYMNFSRWKPEMMSRLCAKALEQGIEVEYVQRLIKKRGLVSATPVENWPYPVKIYTIGKFAIVKDGKPVEFSGKVQKKPLEILKLLIDCGGQALEGHIVDTLWPEAEGDMAHNSFKMALSRLRNLIGKESIKNQDGKISFNPSCCWVDALAARPVTS